MVGNRSSSSRESNNNINLFILPPRPEVDKTCSFSLNNPLISVAWLRIRSCGKILTLQGCPFFEKQFFGRLWDETMVWFEPSFLEMWPVYVDSESFWEQIKRALSSLPPKTVFLTICIPCVFLSHFQIDCLKSHRDKAGGKNASSTHHYDAICGIKVKMGTCCNGWTSAEVFGHQPNYGRLLIVCEKFVIITYFSLLSSTKVFVSPAGRDWPFIAPCWLWAKMRLTISSAFMALLMATGGLAKPAPEPKATADPDPTWIDYNYIVVPPHYPAPYPPVVVGTSPYTSPLAILGTYGPFGPYGPFANPLLHIQKPTGSFTIGWRETCTRDEKKIAHRLRDLCINEIARHVFHFLAY